jgi:hypothetical protein
VDPAGIEGPGVTWVHLLTGWGFAFLPGTFVAAAIAMWDGTPPLSVLRHPVVLAWTLSASVLGIFGAFIGGWSSSPGATGSVRVAIRFVALPAAGLALFVSLAVLLLEEPAIALGIGIAVFLPAPLAAAATAWLVTRAP